MATTTTGTDLDLVTAARGAPRLDSGIDLLVVAPQTSLTALERQQALRSLRAVLRPLPLSVSVDLVVVGEEDARKLAGSRRHAHPLRMPCCCYGWWNATSAVCRTRWIRWFSRMKTGAFWPSKPWRSSSSRRLLRSNGHAWCSVPRNHPAAIPCLWSDPSATALVLPSLRVR